MSELLKVDAIATTTRLALLVRESSRFWLRVATRSLALGRYHLRRSNVVVYLRHGTVDITTLDQIVGRGHYQLPDALVEELVRIERPLRVADLGANIGLFGAYVRRQFPDATIVAVEPHPANVEVLKRTIDANGNGKDWQLVAACADVHDGTVSFSGREFTTARVESGAKSMSLPAVDIFRFIDGVDFLKVDIEGAEWTILADPRFRSVRAAVVALEYHAFQCPESDPRTLARRLLSEAGYASSDADFHATPGHGMLWGWRSS